MRPSQVLGAMATAIAAVAFTPDAAAANCVGPVIEHNGGTVSRNDTIHVDGRFWGDSCYDTGSPPPGQSMLGKPVEDIEVFLEQHGVEYLVASGDADDDLGFSIDVPIPDELTPGPIEVVARWASGDAYNASRQQLMIDDGLPTGASDDTMVRFTAPAPATDGGPVRTILTTAVGLLIAGATVFAAAAYLTRRRRLPAP